MFAEACCEVICQLAALTNARMAPKARAPDQIFPALWAIRAEWFHLAQRQLQCPFARPAHERASPHA